METLLAWKAEIIAIFFGVVATVYAIRGYRLQVRAAPRKAFAVGGVSRVMFNGPVERAEDFEVRFRGQLVKRVTENHALFMNTGNVEISAEDFDKPVRLVLPSTEHVFDCEVIARRPQDLQAAASIAVVDGEAVVTLSPVLLNPGDFVAVRFLRAGQPMTRRSEGRIRGVSRIDPLLPGQYDKWFTNYPLVVGLLGVGALAFAVLTFLGAMGMPSGTFAAILPGAMGVMFLVAGVSHWMRWGALRRASYMGKGTEFLEFQSLVRD